MGELAVLAEAAAGAAVSAERVTAAAHDARDKLEVLILRAKRHAVTATPPRDETPAPVAKSPAAAVLASQAGTDTAEPSHEPEPQAEVLRRLRSHPRLGRDWAVSDDDGTITLWWRRTTRVGAVSKTYSRGRGWQAVRANGVAVHDGRGIRRFNTQIAALSYLAAEADHARRSTTPHAQADIDGLPGWRLTQTQAERDTHTWQVITPHGEAAGHVLRPTWDPKRWQAISEHGTDLTPATFGHDTYAETWPTRTQAARAVAAWDAPDLGIAP